MSQKTTKRFRREVKRHVNLNFGEGVEALTQLTRTRPSWIPKRIWMLAYLPLFEFKYLRIISKYIK